MEYVVLHLEFSTSSDAEQPWQCHPEDSSGSGAAIFTSYNEIGLHFLNKQN